MTEQITEKHKGAGLKMGHLSGMRACWWRCLLCFLLLLPWCLNVQAKIIDGIAAVVNDDVILQSELLELVEPYRREYAAKYSGKELDDRIRSTARALLEAAIERQLLLQEAARRGVEIEESMIDEAVKGIRDRFGSDEEFRKAVAEQGETMATFRRKHEEDLLARKMSQLKLQEIDKEVTISEQDVRDFYEKHKQELAADPKMEFLKMFVSADSSLLPDERAMKRRVLEEALAEVEAGADFEEVAERLAQDDKSGTLEIGRGDLPAELERAILSMREGDVSDILESEQGFYIVKVVRSEAPKVIYDDELRARIRPTLRRQLVQEKWNDWLKKLREDARVSIYFR